MLPTVRRAPTASICATHCASPTFPDSKTCPGNTCRSTRAGCCPERTYEFRHVLRRVEHEHARRLAIQPETVGQPLPPGTGGQLQVGRRCGPRNRQCHAIGDEPASRRIRPQGLHGLGARAGNAPAVKANVAASARRHISATEPKRDAARAPPREHDVAKNGDRSNLTAAPIREQAVGRCHVMPCREPIHGQRGPAPGLGRLQQLTHGARAFLRNLRYPPPRQARGADTTLRVRIIPCMSRPAQHLDLATDAQTGKRRWHSDRRIGAHLQQPGLAQPIVAQGLARGGRGSAASHLRDAAQGHAIAHVVQDMACPRAAVMAALRLELPSCMAAAAPAPGPARRAATTSARTATARTRSRPARVARQAEGTRPSWPALLAFLRRPGSSQPGLPIRAEQGGKLVSPIRARRRPDEIGLRRAGRHDGPGIRIARPFPARHSAPGAPAQ